MLGSLWELQMRFYEITTSSLLAQHSLKNFFVLSLPNIKQSFRLIRDGVSMRIHWGSVWWRKPQKDYARAYDAVNYRFMFWPLFMQQLHNDAIKGLLRFRRRTLYSALQITMEILSCKNCWLHFLLIWSFCFTISKTFPKTLETHISSITWTTS